MTFSRRHFLTAAAASGAYLALGNGSLKHVAFAANPKPADRILVVVHLRGACDGLNLVCPANDPNLITARPAELRVAEQGDKAGLALKTDGKQGIDWRLHPAAPELAELYQSGALAFVHAAGIPEANRSHFVATDIIDHGAGSGGAISRVQGGWLARYLTASRLVQGIAPAVSASTALCGEFQGLAPALSIPDLANGVPLPWDEGSVAAVRALYQGQGDPASRAANVAFKAAEAISAKLGAGKDGKTPPYPNEHEAYDKAQDLGRGLRTIARLIKLDVGLIAASADVGGWDTHEGQQGRFQNNVTRLSKGIGAFWNDLSAYHDRLTLVAYGEFGRRLRANRSGGTDHGRGGVMLVLGGHVKGGRIMGPWPGLNPAQLDERVDLAVATDYRQVLTELLEAHSGATLPPSVFPGYGNAAKLGLVA
jgi:uncharacterized protein (DUF1501 family)